MSSVVSPYDVLVGQLLLPPDILDIVAAPFNDRGYPLNVENSLDYLGKELNYYAANCENRKVALLHLASEIIAEPANSVFVVALVNVFTMNSDETRFAGLFFFAPVKGLNPDYKMMLATNLKAGYPTIKEVSFFDQDEISYLKEKPVPLQKNLVSRLLALDKLFPQRNGSGPVASEPDLTRIQTRVAEILLAHYRNVQGDHRQFFIQVRNNLNLPDGWNWDPLGDAAECSRSLVSYLIGQKSYPASSQMKGYRPLGALLNYLIPSVGGNIANEIYGIIYENRLIELDDVMADLKAKYYKSNSN